MRNRTGIRRVQAVSVAPSGGVPRRASAQLPGDLDLTPVSRWPTRLSEETRRAILRRPLPELGRLGPPLASSGRPDATIVAPTCNNLVFTRMCIESVLANNRDLRFELLIVDNGSTDGTRRYLTRLSRRVPRVRLIFNSSNLGFAAAVNQGLRSARGRNFVILNNDTLVPPNALKALLRRLEDPEVGLVGPVTNRAANEAQVEADYRTYQEMLDFAARHCRARRGASFDIRTPFMFCVAFRRSVYERTGPLDERFGIGLFEDEDYAERVRKQGFRLVCAEDAFVHHFGEASTGKIVEDGGYGELFRANRRRFEEKWNVEWTPHKRRRTEGYERSVADFLEAIDRFVPAAALVLVVSRGDEELLGSRARTAFHFPCADDGSYLGYYPACCRDAIALLEKMRGRGAEFLSFPSDGLWWLDHYRDFNRHLRRNYRVRFESPFCLVFSLGQQEGGHSGAVRIRSEPKRKRAAAGGANGGQAP